MDEAEEEEEGEEAAAAAEPVGFAGVLGELELPVSEYPPVLPARAEDGRWRELPVVARRDARPFRLVELVRLDEGPRFGDGDGDGWAEELALPAEEVLDGLRLLWTSRLPAPSRAK